MERLLQQLQARRWQDYVTWLETLPGKAGSLKELAASQQQQWQTTVRQLGLSPQAPANTIQAVLQQRLQSLNQALIQQVTEPHIGCSAGWECIVDLLRQSVPGDVLHGYFIKWDVLQRLLVHHPPQQLLRHLGYSSIRLCLEQEPIIEIVAALRFAESETWMDEHIQLFSTLTTADFEDRPVQFLMLPPERWWQLAEPFASFKRHHFSHLKEAGVIFSFPPPGQFNQRAELHRFVLLLLHYIFEVQFYSNWFRYNITRLSNFGQTFIEILKGDKSICAADRYHLPIIQQYHLKKLQPHPCVFEPHVMPEGLHWRKAGAVFFSILRDHPQAADWSFWENCYTVAQIIAGQLVTFNFFDNALSRNLPLTYHFREDLWNSIFSQYFSEAVLERTIIQFFAVKQIDLRTLS